MSQNTREKVFPATLQHRVGTLLMFAVRSIFARSDRVAAAMRDLAAAGQVPQWLADTPDPLGFLIHPGGASSLTDAAYRYVRHEPGVDVVLFGTGDQAHLRSNIESILRPPLPDADRKKLAELFGHLRGWGWSCRRVPVRPPQLGSHIMKIAKIEDLHCDAGWRDFLVPQDHHRRRAGRLVGIQRGLRQPRA